MYIYGACPSRAVNGHGDSLCRLIHALPPTARLGAESRAYDKVW